jgi:hypothetical protein
VSSYQKPWWLIISTSHQITSTVRDESQPGERVFVVRGEPHVQGLTWLACGPISALFIIGVMVGLAITFGVKEQGLLAQILFIAAFLALPALAWGTSVVLINRASKKHIQALKETGTQECVIRLRQKEGLLFYQLAGAPTEEQLPYNYINAAKATPAIGARSSKSMNLTLQTEDGPIVLLNEALGTQVQKVDLAREIQMSLDRFATNKKPSPES